MERNWDLSQMTDGKKYMPNDMVKVGCNDCKGCDGCCNHMGSSITLDPLDVYRLCKALGTTLEELLSDMLELNLVDGVILPNLKMQGEDEVCGFLNGEGRCSIHASRPGICRLFPLGRLYEDDSFSYILQVGQCKAKNPTKMKVSKWIDTPNLKQNQEFILKWHTFLKGFQNRFKGFSTDEEMALMKQIDMQILQVFFLTPYNLEEDFYPQFYKRLEAF